MGWQVITKNILSVVKQIIKFIENHWLLSGAMGLIMGHFLDISQIVAGAIIFVAAEALLSLTDFMFSSRKCRYVAYAIVLIIYVLIILFCWKWLVYFCDRNNPYKQSLQTGTATIEIVINSINKPEKDLCLGYNSGTFTLLKKQDVLLSMTSPNSSYYPSDSNKTTFKAAGFILNDAKNVIGKPIYNLTKAESAEIYMCGFSELPENSKVISGEVNLIFNYNAPIKIKIPSNIMDGNKIIIEDIQKHLTRGN